MASRKLKQYFLGHPITVVSSDPLGDIIHNREATGRIAKWAIELGPHGLKYMPRTAIKSQAWVDFINDWTELQMPEENPYNTYWTIHFDGSRQLEGSGAGVVLTSTRGDKFCYVLRLMFPCTNNAAEYEALLHGLRMAKEMNLSRVRCFGDSDLVAQQVSGTLDSKDPLMAAYRREVDVIAGHFKGYLVEHVDRRKNEVADALSRLGSQRKPVPPNVFLDILHNPSVKLPTEEDLAIPNPEAQLVAALHLIPDLTVPYLAYMTRGELPEDETLARQITRRSKSMIIVNGELHHRSVTGAFQHCVSPEEGCEILRKIHEGDCSHHAGSKSLVAKAFCPGFYWLTAHVDAEDLVSRCDGCQKFSRRAHVTAQELRMIPITWPYAVWGLDMVAHFKRSKDKKTHLLGAVENFTK